MTSSTVPFVVPYITPASSSTFDETMAFERA